MPRLPGDPIDRAHLTGRSRPTPPIYRYAPAADLVSLVARYWVPVWSLDEPQRQRTLQHPACLIVISNTYARFYGAVAGLSEVTLEGDGWAVGTMLTPGAGAPILGGPVSEVTDRYVDLREITGLEPVSLIERVEAVMGTDPHAVPAHRAAIGVLEDRLRTLLPLDEPGVVVNRAVTWLLEHPSVTRVSELAAELGLSERTLQRLVVQRVGLTPKWLIQRRRLHDAVERLKAGSTSLSALGADLGYTDQAHFTHDFRTITGMTPGEFLRDQR